MSLNLTTMSLNLTTMSLNLTTMSLNLTTVSLVATSTPPGKPDIIKQIDKAIFVLTVTSFLLNGFVLFRILHQNITKVHHAKLFFLSLAISDLLCGCSCLCFCLENLNIIPHIPINVMSLWWDIMTQLACLSSLFHVIIITVDRFIATKYPIKHKIKVTKRKAIYSILALWVTSIVIVLPNIWK